MESTRSSVPEHLLASMMGQTAPTCHDAYLWGERQVQPEFDIQGLMERMKPGQPAWKYLLVSCNACWRRHAGSQRSCRSAYSLQVPSLDVQSGPTSTDFDHEDRALDFWTIESGTGPRGFHRRSRFKSVPFWCNQHLSHQADSANC